ADVQVQGGHLHAGIPPIPVKDVAGPHQVHAELRLLFAGCGIDVGLGVDVRVDAQSGPYRAVPLRGDPDEVLQLLLRFDVEPADARLDALSNFRVRLADAGEDDLRRVGTGLQRPRQFAPADHVKRGPALS